MRKGGLLFGEFYVWTKILSPNPSLFYDVKGFGAQSKRHFARKV
jgi:hypothetical protein